MPSSLPLRLNLGCRRSTKRSSIGSNSATPAGLHLLLQALPTTLTITDAHLHVSAHNVDLVDYLEHDVLHHTPEHERDFLIRTSLLPYLNASLCQAVSGCEAGKCEALLMRITEHNGLVITLTKAGRAVRFQVHPVLRRFLLQQLNLQLDSTHIRALRRSAATALAVEGDVDSALELLLPSRIVQEETVLSVLGDDIDAAADLVQSAAAAELWNGDPATLQRWTAHLPHAAIVARPRLAVEAAWASHHGVEYDQHHALPTMRAAMAGRCIDDDLQADASLLEAIELVRHGHMEAAAEHLQTARAVCRDLNSRAAGYLEGVEACTMLHSQQRSLSSRLQQLDFSIQIFQRCGYIRGQLDAFNQAIWISRNYADVRSVLAMARRALDYYNSIGWQHTLFAVYAHLHMSEMLYYLNRIDEARESCRRALATAEMAGMSKLIAYDVRVRLQLCDIAEGQPAELLSDDEDAQGWESSRRHFYPMIAIFAGYRRILRDMCIGQVERCWKTVESLGVNPYTLNEQHQAPIQLCAFAGALFSDRDSDILFTLMQEAEAFAEARSHHFVAMHLKLLLVLHAQRRGDVDRALPLLHTLTLDVQRTGMLRLLLDFPQLSPLLKQLDTEYAQLVLSRMQRCRTPTALTSQERRIIAALAAGTPTSGIAADLVVSIETVRTHVRNILRKLDVHNREEAVRIAREIGIVR